MSRRILSLLIVLCLILPLAISCAPASSTSTPGGAATPSVEATPTPWVFDGANYKGKVKVGVLCNLTGYGALEGEGERNGFMLAVDEWNAKGGINGYEIVAQYEDDQTSAEGALTAFSKLAADKDILGVVGPIKSSGVGAIVDTIIENKIPVLEGGTSPVLEGKGEGWMFRMRASDVDVGTVAAKYLAEEMKVKKLGILYNNDDYGNGARGVIVDYLEKNTDVEIVVQEGHNVGDKDMTGALVKVKNAGCDGMIVWAHEMEAAIVCRQYTELGLEDAGVRLLGGPIWGMGSLYAVIDDAFIDGQKGVMEYSPGNEDPISKAFTEAYREKFGIDPISMSANWYDGAYILFYALEMCGEDFTRDNIRINLPKVDFEGVTSHIFLGKNGFDFVHRAFIGEVKAENNQKLAINMEKVDTETK